MGSFSRRQGFVLKLIVCCVCFLVNMNVAAKKPVQETLERQERAMISIRKAADRGISQNSWLKSFHTFSFSDYYDPKFMGFRALRVINEDTVQGGKGFDSHPHKDMEIITYVVKGSLQHQDSMGNKTVIRSGEVQRMSAGSGVIHSEYNHEKNEAAHFYQIWITPKSKGGVPSYGQKYFTDALNKKNLVLVVSEDGRENSIPINQDANLYLAKLKKGELLDYPVKQHRHIWVQLIKGKLKVGDFELSASDAISSSDASNLQFRGEEDAEFMIFDLS